MPQLAQAAAGVALERLAAMAVLGLVVLVVVLVGLRLAPPRTVSVAVAVAPPPKMGATPLMAVVVVAPKPPLAQQVRGGPQCMVLVAVAALGVWI